jgi:hypothetical protein
MTDKLNKFISGLKDSHEGETCLLLTCGPSINDYTEEELIEFVEVTDATVVAVKQSYFKIPDLVNYHFFNCCNLPPPENGRHYDYTKYSEIPPLTIASSTYTYGSSWNAEEQHADLFFKIPALEEKPELIAETEEFEKYTLEKTADRPCGPGIMYETVIFWLEHLGFKNIVALGWDLSKASSHEKNEEVYQHFYKSDVYNRGVLLGWDVKVTREASKALYYWLKSKGTQLSIGSTQSHLYDGIPRIDLNVVVKTYKES